MTPTRTVQDSISVIQNFLTPVREQAQKEAAMRKTAAESFKDTSEAKPQALAEPKPGSTTQSNLGVEQQQTAVEGIGGQPATTAKPNSEADGQWFADNQGPRRMDTDQKVTDGGNIGPIVRTEITQEQKIARAEGLANAILSTIAGTLHKQAADAAVQPKTLQTPPTQIPNTGMPGRGLGGDRAPAGAAAAGTPGGQITKTASEQVFEKMAGIAAGAAQEYYQGMLAGMMKRGQDEFEVMNSGIHPEVLQKMGGVDGLLDKVAAAFPEAIMPEGAEAGMPVGAEGGMPPGAEGGMPPGAEGGAGISPDEMAAKLDEAGVTPEELQQALEDVAALQQAGVSVEDLQAAMADGSLGGGEAGGGEAPAGGEGAPEKEASRRVRTINTLQQIFSARR